MKTFAPPPGFHAHTLPHASGWFRPEQAKFILSFWKKTGKKLRLSEAAQRHPQAQRLTGRRVVTAAPISGAGTVVVRPCAHGGWWGHLAQDLYFGSHRALREVCASERLDHMKIPTPRIEAVLFYPAGPFTRTEVATTMIPKSMDLVRSLAARPRTSDRARIFTAVRKLFSQLHHHGVRHPDLNARNILLASCPRGRVVAWLLDVDVIRFGQPGSASISQANRARLLRSLLKRARLGELGWSEAEVPQLWRELFPRR